MRYVSAVKRAVKRAFLEDAVGDAAAAITYYAFLAIPSLLLMAVGFFGLFAGPDTVARLMDELTPVAPEEAVTLLEETLTRVTENRGGGLIMVLVGFAVAAWTGSGAMGAVIRALNRIFGELEGRGFVRQRAIGLVIVGVVLLAFALVFALLVLGPYVAGWTGLGGIWWIAQWPVLLGGLLLAFGIVYWLGPNRRRMRFRPVTAGAVLAAAIWLVVSGGFALYANQFGAYGEAWGPVAAVIVLMTWLWLSSLALLLGAELDAELEGCRD